MFEVLTDKLSAVFRKLGSRGKLTEKDIDEALRQVRLALLEADVNFKVVKEFTARVRERSLEAQVLESLTPAQQIVKIVNEELVKILGEGESRLEASSHSPSVIMLAGLQGSGKTTTAAKLALNLKHSGQKPLLVAADNRRPAAIEQLVTLGGQLDVPVYHETVKSKSKDVCSHALKKARELGANWVIADTAGRMHIDEELMAELAEVKKEIKPAEVLLVVDAMTGQDAVQMADEFNSRLGLTGLILTKMDGDARGGAALSIRWVSGVPIKFMGVGEKTFDQKRVKELEKKVKTASFTLEDFLDQLGEIQKMGPVAQLVEMLPGASKLARGMPDGMQEKQLKKVEAVIRSMTPGERQNPNIIDGSRRRRIARGSGVMTQDVNQLLNQFRQMQKLMKMGAKGKLPSNLKGLFG